MDNESLNLLSIGEAAEYLGVSIDTLRRWEKKGKLVSYRSPGGHRYFKKNELDQMFGKKYERSEEINPRKDYEKKPKELKQEERVEMTEILEVSDESDEIQKTVDKITVANQEETVPENILERQPRNIDVPKIEPIRIKLVPDRPPDSKIEILPEMTRTVQPQPRLFTSFSQLPDQNIKPPSKPKSIPYFYILLIVAAVVAITALFFGIFYFTSQPEIISPLS